MAAIAEKTGFTVEQVTTMLQGTSEYIVEQSIQCWRLEPILGWFGFQGTCGGSQPTSDFFPSFKNLAVNISMSLGKPALNHAKSIFHAENVGHSGLLVPVITRVTNMNNGVANSYTPGGTIQIELQGRRGKLDRSDTMQGVFFKNGTGLRTRSSSYGLAKGSLIVCTVPTTLTGAQELSVSLIINKGLRTGIFSTPLTLLSSEEPTPPTTNGNGQRAAKGANKGLALTN